MKNILLLLSFALLFASTYSTTEDDHKKVLELFQNPTAENAEQLASHFSCNVIVIINDVRIPNTTTTKFCTEDFWSQHFDDVTLTNMEIKEFDDEGNGQYFSRVTCTATNPSNGQSSEMELFEWWLEEEDGKVIYWNRWEGSELLKQFHDGGVGKTRPSSTYAEVLRHLEDGDEETCIILASLFDENVAVILNGVVLDQEETQQYSNIMYWEQFFRVVELSNSKVVDFEDLGEGQYTAKMTSDIRNKMNGQTAKLTVTERWLEDTNGKIVFWERTEEGDLMDNFYSNPIDDHKAKEYADVMTLLESKDADALAKLFSCDVVVVVNDEPVPTTDSSRYCTSKYWEEQFSEFSISDTDVIEFDDLGGGQYSARMSFKGTNLKTDQTAVMEIFEWWLEDEGKIVYWNRFDDSDLVKKFHEEMGSTKPRRNVMCKNRSLQGPK